MEKKLLYWGRQLLLLMTFLLPGLLASAQVGRYVFSQTVAPYVPITGGTLVDQSAANYGPGFRTLYGTVYLLPPGTIPFPFRLNDSSYTGAGLTSSGYLTFGSALPHTWLDVLPGSTGGYNIYTPLSEPVGTDFEAVLAPLAGRYWGNSTPGSLAELRYETLGTAPNRVFVVQWSQMRVFSAANSNLDFQLRLYETTNVVEFAYGSCYSDEPLPVQVGLRGSTTNDWTNRTGTWAASTAGASNAATLTVAPGSAPAAGLVYRFSPAPPQPCPVPFSLQAVPGGTQAQLSWRAASPSAGPYTLVYGLAGFDPTSGGLGTQTGLTTTTTVLTGLTPATEYEFYVGQSCGAAGNSPTSAPPGRFRTTIINDEPVDATPLPVGTSCQPVSSSTAGATRSAANGYDPLVDCNGFSPVTEDADVWFTLTTAASGPASQAMQLTATGAVAVRIRVFSSANGAAGPFTQLYCQANATNAGAFAPFVLAGLSPSTTYYLLVDNGSQRNPTGPFTLCATVPPACGDPTNVVANYAASTPTTTPLSFQAGAGALSYTVTLTPQVPAGGSPLTFTIAGGSTATTLTGLSPATTYAGTLQATCAGGGLSAAIPFTVYSRPVNDLPADAIVLPIAAACQPVTGSTLNSTSTTPAITPTPTGCGLAAPRDVWYRFTTPATGPASQAVRLEVTGNAASQVRVFELSTGSSLRQIICAGTANNTPAPLLDVVGLSPGGVYYVQVGHFGTPYSGGGPFTICLSEPPACGAPRNVAVSNVLATTATLTFTAGVPAASAGYTLTLTPQGYPATTLTAAGTGGTIALTGLQPGTFYTLTLQSNCGAAGLSLPAPVPAITFRTPGAPSNDLCTNAQPIQCGTGPVSGVVTGATATGQPITSCGGSAPLGPGVWYQLPGTGQDVTLSFCSGYADDPDLQVLVYTGTCGALQCVGSNDNSTACSSYPRLPTLTFATIAGQTYYVLVADTGRPLAGTQSSGQFDMEVSCAASAACPPPTGLSLTQLGATAATAGWVADPGASSYQVVWQPVNGSTLPMVTTVAAPPATVTQLLPNTPYLVTVSAVCGPAGLRSIGAAVQFTTLLGSRQPALAAQVELYPNPAHQATTVLVPRALRTADAVPLVLYNALGQAVRTLRLPADGPLTTTLDLQGLPTGAYLLRLQTAHGAVSKRLLVE